MSTPTNRPSLKLIAEACGVSIATVSLALRNSPRISETRRKEIRACADGMGYAVNPLLNGMMRNVREGHGSRTIGNLAYLHWMDSDKGFSAGNHYIQRWYQGARGAAAGMSCGMELIGLRAAGLNPLHLQRILRSRGVQGLLVSSIPGDGVSLDLDWAQFVGVAIGFSFKESKIHRVVPDLYQGGLDLIAHCRSQGHHRIGLAMHDRRAEDVTNHRFSSAYFTEASLGRIVPGIPVFHAEPDQPAQSRSRFLKWIDRHALDCVVISNDMFFDWLLAAGSHISPEIGVALWGRSQRHPHLCALRQNHETIGSRAAQLLINEMVCNGFGAQSAPILQMTPVSVEAGQNLRPFKAQ